jgi:hypothetical protein
LDGIYQLDLFGVCIHLNGSHVSTNNYLWLYFVGWYKCYL